MKSFSYPTFFFPYYALALIALLIMMPLTMIASPPSSNAQAQEQQQQSADNSNSTSSAQMVPQLSGTTEAVPQAESEGNCCLVRIAIDTWAAYDRYQPSPIRDYQYFARGGATLYITADICKKTLANYQFVLKPTDAWFESGSKF